MLLNCIILAISSSIDSLGIGITYGIKNTKFFFTSKIILFTISIIISSISVLFGKILSTFLPKKSINLFGCVILFIIGTFVIIKAIHEKTIGNEIHYDFNKSNLIDPQESIFLGLALSLDCFGIGISSSLIGTTYIIFPIFISLFQFIFLNLGITIGKKIKKHIKCSDFIWSIISGILLILIGICTI